MSPTHQAIAAMAEAADGAQGFGDRGERLILGAPILSRCGPWALICRTVARAFFELGPDHDAGGGLLAENVCEKPEVELPLPLTAVPLSVKAGEEVIEGLVEGF